MIIINSSMEKPTKNNGLVAKSIYRPMCVMF